LQAFENVNLPAGATSTQELSGLVPDQRPSITHSSRWVFAGTILSKPIQLFTAVLLARLVGPAGFGVFGLATSIALTLSLVAGLGLGDAIYKYVAEYYRKDRERGTRFAGVIIWSSTVTATVVFVALWLCRNLWVGWIFPPATTATIVGLCLCLAWTNLTFALLSGVFSGLQRFREFAVMNLLQATAVAGFVLVLAFYGSEGALLAYVLGSSVCLVWSAIKLWLTDDAIFSWPGWKSFRQLKTIMKFSAPIWVSAFALTPVITFTFAFLARQPNGEYQLGVFSTANGLRSLVLILPGVISVVIAPALLEEGGMHGDVRAYKQLLEKALFSLIFLTVPLLILSLFLSDILFRVYGKAYGDAFRLFMPLTASAAIAAIGAPIITVMMAKNRTWVSLGFGMIKSLLVVALTLLVVPRYLGWGLAWAFFFSEISYYFLAVEFCARTGAISSFFRRAFYWSCLGIWLILVLSLYLPVLVRWVAALPLTLVLFFLLLRGRSEIGNWIAHLAPVKLRPGTQRLMRLITS
jgi:O-antigen/teichoic acid export membrane protein